MRTLILKTSLVWSILLGANTYTSVAFAGGGAAPANASKPSKYSYVDPGHVVPSKALGLALDYYDANKGNISNTKYLSVIDFTQHSGKKRFYIINMSSGSVWQIHTAHGSGSDGNADGYADSFSNVSGSNASSLGFYRTAEVYDGSHGRSLRLDGYSKSNSNVRERAVVIHAADYVSDNLSKMGRSWGCPAVSWNDRDAVIDHLMGGSVILGYHESYF
jgi:hypothetical protein